MFVLITYDVKAQTKDGRGRLRRISKTCLGFGQRAQYSVFECDVDSAQWAGLHARLLSEYTEAEGRLRFYFPGQTRKRQIEHCGAKPATDFDGTRIV